MNNPKTALVTGASRGIGRAVALQLAKDGHYVLVNYLRDEAAALDTMQQIHQSGGAAELLRFDVTDEQAVTETLETWQQTHPGQYISVLVNNAGIRKDNLMIWQTTEEWDSVLKSNLSSFFYVTKPLLKDMIFHKSGRIINIASLSGIRGMQGQANYAASKGGLIAATKSLALELARKNITVNAVAPGFIQTDMVAGLPEDELKKTIPMNRFGTPEEVAGIVGFLAGASASYITGEVISVNGGLYT